MRQRPFSVAGTAAAVLTMLATATAAQVDRRLERPPDEARVLYRRLPDITVTTSAGVRLRLSEVANGQPMILGFAFTRCTGVCSPFLRSWRAADSSVSRIACHRLVLSFDPRDTPRDMAALAQHLGAAHDATWTFAVAAPSDLQRLAAATGFWYDWSEERQQFDHPAMLAAIRHGSLVRLLVGGEISSGRLNELVREASGEFVASYPLPSRVRFRCFQYDAATGRLSLDWGFALLLVPVGSAAALTATMFTAGARARSRHIRPR